MRDMNEKVQENWSSPNFMKRVKKIKILGYLNLKIPEKIN